MTRRLRGRVHIIKDSGSEQAPRRDLRRRRRRRCRGVRLLERRDSSSRSRRCRPIPPAGRGRSSTIFIDPGPKEGLAIVDVNLDGVDDIVGAGRWFEYVGPSTWTVHEIDPAMEFTRAAAGQLMPGRSPGDRVRHR